MNEDETCHGKEERFIFCIEWKEEEMVAFTLHGPLTLQDHNS